MKRIYSSTSSEHIVSDNYADSDKQQGGSLGVFGSGKSKLITEMALEAFGNRKIKEGAYIISNGDKHNIKVDLKKCDDSGRTLLHHLVMYCAYDIEVKETLGMLLMRKDIKKYINCQDIHKNTPAHYALSLNQINVLRALVSAGADTNIKNDEGFYIKTSSKGSVKQSKQYDMSTKPNSVFVKCSGKKGMHDSLLNASDLPFTDVSVFGYTEEMDRELSKIVKKAVVSENLIFDKNVMTEEPPLKAIIKKQYMSEMEESDNDELAMTDFLNMIMDQHRGKPKNSSKQFELEHFDDDDDDENNIIMSLQGGAKKTKNAKNGGKKIKVIGRITGERQFKNNDNPIMSVSIGGGSETSDYSEGSFSDNLSEMAKSVKSKSTELHEKAVQKIMDLMKCDETTARNYKAYIYKKVRTEQPLLNGYDRANEMLNLITKKMLESIDVKKVAEEIKEKLSSKSSEMSDSSKQSRSSSVKSSEYSDTESGTSDDDNDDNDTTESSKRSNFMTITSEDL
jgi:ankyrin repeat protein